MILLLDHHLILGLRLSDCLQVSNEKLLSVELLNGALSDELLTLVNQTVI